MKHIIIVLLSLLSVEAFSEEVKGHQRTNGAWVNPYYRSDANSITWDNYGAVQPITKPQDNPTYTYGSAFDSQYDASEYELDFSE